MNIPTLYILCGLPFSGKTVLTKQLVEKLDFAKVNIDDIKFSHGYEWADDDHVPDKAWDKIFKESHEQTIKYLKEGKSVLYDCANLDLPSRDKLRKLASDNGFSAKLIFVDVPLETVKERWQANRTSKERFDLPDGIFQAALDSWEPPTKDENPIRYTQEMELETWIKENFEV